MGLAFSEVAGVHAWGSPGNAPELFVVVAFYSHSFATVVLRVNSHISDTYGFLITSGGTEVKINSLKFV